MCERVRLWASHLYSRCESCTCEDLRMSADCCWSCQFAGPLEQTTDVFRNVTVENTTCIRRNYSETIRRHHTNKKLEHMDYKQISCVCPVPDLHDATLVNSQMPTVNNHTCVCACVMHRLLLINHPAHLLVTHSLYMYAFLFGCSRNSPFPTLTVYYARQTPGARSAAHYSTQPVETVRFSMR